MNLQEWMKDGKHLPQFMRDFHDQKRLFKRLDEIVQNDRLHSDMPNWLTAHMYVVDFFLWYMARRGWTLQRSRASFEFVSLEDDLQKFDRRQYGMPKPIDTAAPPVVS